MISNDSQISSSEIRGTDPRLVESRVRPSLSFHLICRFSWVLDYDLLFMAVKSLQEKYSPEGICFGCGVANSKGLQIRSFEDHSGEYVCEWRAEDHHQAFPGMLNGGIIGALLDCHCNWAAAHFLMIANGKTKPDCTVTANYTIKLRRPTPKDSVIHLKARVVESEKDRAVVEAELIAGDKVCATCKGLFVIVKEGHPAYHRW